VVGSADRGEHAVITVWSTKKLLDITRVIVVYDQLRYNNTRALLFEVAQAVYMHKHLNDKIYSLASCIGGIISITHVHE
jgi:hypothetical protein